MVGERTTADLSYCQAVKRFLVGDRPGSHLSTRATVALDRARKNFEWLKADQTSLVTENSQTRWWTFGGLLANSGLAAMLREAGVRVGRADNFAIRIEDSAAAAQWDSITNDLRSVAPEHIVTPVDPKALSQLKFSECLPRELGSKELEARLTDRTAIAEILSQRLSLLNSQ
jgi:ATP-dependent helicase Lhr and Lhr-like helicase